MTVSKDLLLKESLPEAEVDIPGKGTVRVRAMTRLEVIAVQKVQEKGWDRMERMLLSIAMLEPALTEGEVLAWQKGSTAGEIEPVTTRVMELSGMIEGAAKEAYKEFDADPDAEFRALPGRAAVDDGGTDAAGDAPR